MDGDYSLKLLMYLHHNGIDIQLLSWASGAQSLLFS